MKKIRIITAIAAVATIGALGAARAQETNTLFFLENAPMRHMVNPALQPVSNGYINFTPLGYSSFQVGNNSLTMSDLVYNKDGKTITAMYPGEDRQQLLRCFRSNTLLNMQTTTNWLSFGWRHQENGYIHINIMQRMSGGMNLPKSMANFLLNGGMTNMTGTNYLDMHATGMGIQSYTEFAGGYSYRINEQWTVGGKVKFLLGQAYAEMKYDNLGLDASVEEWRLHGNGTLVAAGPLNWNALPDRINRGWLKDNKNYDWKKIMPDVGSNIGSYLTPSGYGAAIDLGFTYKPHPQVQISAALNDLGFIYWNRATQYRIESDTTFYGVGDFEYKDYVNPQTNQFETDSLLKEVGNRALDLLNNIQGTRTGKKGFARMVHTRLNIGVDANFCNNILGLGVLSSTQVYYGRFYTELTFGGALRPCNWFNLAVSYSLLNNGKYSNIGAGLSFMPYDGINLTLAADYIPTSYASTEPGGKAIYPYRSKGVNVALGFSIVWGTNHKKDSDKDGVWDKLDMCPNTPKGVRVDKIGCPLDTDGDGVPDYLDLCPGTPVAAYGLTDSVGCPIDTDGDGVPDYLDKCDNTPKEAWGYLDEHGCELDTDGDGVPDWRDSCPNTPKEAWGYVDSLGCELDTDGDGVPDWKDLCPNTPKEAWGHVDAFGCELDTDGDGIVDWKDACPTVAGPKENKGCPVITKEVRTLLTKAMQGIEFESGKATIKKKSYPLLDEIAQIFTENKTYIIEVQGHTDNTGSEKVNTELSDKRAKAVREYMVNKGVSTDRITAKGYGPAVPIADNKTKAGRQKNRRVEFKITFEEVHYEQIYDHAEE